jgi:TP901 family phage tail tape measure protein
MPNKVAYSFVAHDKFVAVARRVGRATDAVRRKFHRLGPTARKASATVSGAFARMTVAAKGFMRSGLAPLVAGFASIAGIFKFLKLGTGFEDSIADLQAITGAAGKDLAFMSGEAMRLGSQAKIASSEVGTAFKLVASAKSELLKDPKALSVVTEQMLLLKNATGLEMGEAVTFGVASLNQFGAGADQASRFVNVLAASAKIGAAEVGDVGLALRNVGPVADIAALSFEETNAAIQVLAKSGQKGALAGTGLRGVLLKLNKAIPFDKVGGFSNALELVAKKTEHLSASQRLLVLQELFGEEMVKAGVPLVENVALLREFTQGMTGTNEAVLQAQIRLGTMSARMRGIGVNIQNFLIKAFNQLAPRLKETIDKMEKWAMSLDADAVKEFARRIGLVFKLLSPLGKILFTLLKVVNVVLTPVTFVLDILASKLESLAKILDAIVSVPGKVVEIAREKGPGLLEGVKSRAAKLFGKEELDVKGSAEVSQSATMESTVTLKAPKGVIASAKTKTSGTASGLKVGLNVVEELP